MDVWLGFMTYRLPFIVVLVACQFSFAQVKAKNSTFERISIDDNGHVHITASYAKDLTPPAEKTQVGAESAKISEDKRTAGWLVTYPNCCTSYPIALTLVLYRVDQPLLRLGNGMLICDWRFLRNGTQVAFSTNTVHGDLAPHFELHDVKSGRLLGEWDGHLDDRSPKWAQGLSN